MPDNQPSSLIELNNVSRHFASGTETVAVLKNISLTINAGEMVAIIGASGSGKSTLMNIIGCLDQPTEGAVRIKNVETQGANSNELAQLRSQYIGFIFQRYHLMPYLSAAENVSIPSLYTAMQAHDRQERVKYLLTRLGLESRMDYKPSQLSGGQQQRVSVARALMNGPEIILADEPTGALDSNSGKELMSILHSLHNAGHTVVIVTHDRDIARQAERIIEISDGEIIADRPNDIVPQTSSADEHDMPVVSGNGRPPFWLGVIEAVRMAWRSLLGHRVRAVLSMLGIIIGIASVISSMAIGEGTKQRILSEISSLGANTLEARPGLGWGRPRPDFAMSLTMFDVELLSRQPYVDSVSPVMTRSVVAVRNGKETMLNVTGVNTGYFRAQSINFQSGNGFTQRDVNDREPVLIIDDKTQEALFEPGEAPEGEIIQLSGIPFRVIGVTGGQGQSLTGRSLTAWTPYTSLMERMAVSMPMESITLRVLDGYSVESVQPLVDRLLEQAHGRKDFFTSTNDQLNETVRRASNSMTLLITAIAGISLLVGGVGVMNIMLVSVTERTHEIGIRLSVGARPADIMRQFLIEAMVICFLGGVSGVFCSGITWVVSSMVTDEITMIFTAPPIVLACSFSAIIGLGFGFFPARNAARLNPTEALARE